MNPNTPPQPGSPQAPQAPQALLIGLLIAGALLCALAFWAGANWNTWMQKRADRPSAISRETKSPKVTPVEDEVIQQDDEVREEAPSPIEELPDVVTWVDIDWLSADQQTVTLREPIVPTGDVYFDTELIKEEYWPRDFTLGTVSDGEYRGSTLVMEVEVSSGMGMSYRYQYVLHRPNGQKIHLGRYDAVYGIGSIAWQNPVDEYATIGIRELEPAVEIVRDTTGLGYVELGAGLRIGFPEVWITESWDSSDGIFAPFPVDDYEIVGTLEDGSTLRFFTGQEQVRSGVEQGFFTVRPDQRLVWYDAQIPFLDGLTQPADARETGVPNVVLNGEHNTTTYLKGAVGGCGFTSVVNVVDESVVNLDSVVGYFVEGERVNLYGPAVEDDRTVTNGVPYFYWKDDHGRWIEFMNSEIAPAVECGKPVIYLYPEETTDVSVKLWPKGGFTVTEPAYNGGWNVTASPDGTLVNKADGLTYPYLFWEGRGGLYTEPTRYWVVAREDVHAFLVDTLAELGLNEKETADFLEFWEPRMQESAYYKIGFHGTQVMDQIAPMRVSGGPDTIVRILMDYTELDAWAPSLPPSLPPTPVREGFTVIEWGGVLR